MESFFDRIFTAVPGTFFYLALAVIYGFYSAKKTRIRNLPIVAFTAGVIISIIVASVYAALPALPQSVFLIAYVLGFLLLWNLPNAVIRHLFPSFLGRLLQKGKPEALPELSTHGTASWGTAENAANAGHISPHEPAFALGRIGGIPQGIDNKFYFMGHVVTCAPTGSGKGIGSIIPNLLSYPGSSFVLDLKGENLAVTARQRRAMGQKVFCVDPFNVTGTGGDCFNILDRVDLSSPDCVGEASSIAECLVIRSAKSGDSAFFDDSAQNYLQALILYVKTLSPELQNLREVRRLVSLEGKDFDALIVDMIMCESGYGVVSRMGSAMKGKPEKERGSVLSTVQQHTAFLDDPRIAEALSRSDFDLGQLVAEPVTVYLVLPPSRLANNARFVRGFIGSALAALTSSDVRPRYRVTFFLDELAQLGYMRQIEDAISLVRGYRGVFLIYLQDLSQIKAVYEKWQSFLANAAKVFYGTADFDTAKYVSESLGKRTIEYTTTGHSTGDRSSSTSQSQQITGRELLTPDEVMRLGPERPLVLISGEDPYMLYRLNYLMDSEYQGLYDANPHHS